MASIHPTFIVTDKRANGEPVMFHTAMQCYVDKVEYDPRTRVGALYADGYCDMPACVRLFLSIDPQVRQIRTFVRRTENDTDYRPDTIYTRDPVREWRAYLPSNAR